MSNKLGQAIGVVSHTFSIKNDMGDEVKSLTVKIDFSSASDNDVKNWLCANRVIAGQRPWRKLNLKELKALDGKTFKATTIGMKVKSIAEQRAAIEQVLRAAGVAEEDLDAMVTAALEKINA